LAVCGAGRALHSAPFSEWLPGIEWAEPKLVKPGEGAAPPSDAVVLFDGTSLDAWDGGPWKIENGVAIDDRGDLFTKQAFGDCQLHLEFATPEKVSGRGQGRGNSGVLFMGRYEVQILDSFDNKTYFDGQCAAIYKQHPPLVNACRGPGEWQSYDILFTAPRFQDGKLAKPAAVTVLQNGVAVQNHWVFEGDTPYDRAPKYDPHPEKLPLRLQWHGNPIKFRNIWIRELKEVESKRIHEPRNR
jgi:hypothetical protein